MTNSTKTCVLIVAKAPVAGRVKTRLCPPANATQAADIAASALLDTLDAVRATDDVRGVVALAGSLENASRATEIRAALAGVTVLAQRGEDFAARLAAAHADVARLFPTSPVLQIGMDTPQVNSRHLTSAIELLNSTPAVLGPATDGGWWLLGLRDPRAASVLLEVPMSRSDTATRTLDALRRNGIAVGIADELSDVDTMVDALAVASSIPRSRFAAAVNVAHAVDTVAQRHSTDFDEFRRNPVGVR